MKRSIIFSACALLIVLSGCEVTLRDDFKEKIGGVVDKAEQLKEDVTDTAHQVTQKVEDIKNAVDAVNKVFDSGEEEKDNADSAAE